MHWLPEKIKNVSFKIGEHQRKFKTKHDNYMQAMLKGIVRIIQEKSKNIQVPFDRSKNKWGSSECGQVIGNGYIYCTSRLTLEFIQQVTILELYKEGRHK